MRGSLDSVWYPLGLSSPDPLVLNRVRDCYVGAFDLVTSN